MPGLFEKKNTKKAKVEPSYILCHDVFCQQASVIFLRTRCCQPELFSYRKCMQPWQIRNWCQQTIHRPNYHHYIT